MNSELDQIVDIGGIKTKEAIMAELETLIATATHQAQLDQVQRLHDWLTSMKSQPITKTELFGYVEREAKNLRGEETQS